MDGGGRPPHLDDGDAVLRQPAMHGAGALAAVHAVGLEAAHLHARLDRGLGHLNVLRALAPLIVREHPWQPARATGRRGLLGGGTRRQGLQLPPTLVASLVQWQVRLQRDPTAVVVRGKAATLPPLQEQQCREGRGAVAHKLVRAQRQGVVHLEPPRDGRVGTAAPARARGCSAMPRTWAASSAVNAASASLCARCGGVTTS